jgi:hypothetical protein
MLFKSCKDISALVLAREDRPIGLTERAHIRFHMLICKACPKFERQILTLRQGLKNWRAYSERD